MAPAFLFKLGNDLNPPVYHTVAGLRATSIVRDGGLVIDAEGIFLGSGTETETRNLALSGAVFPAQLSFEDGNKVSGNFLLTRMDYAGELNGERRFSLRLSQVRP